MKKFYKLVSLEALSANQYRVLLDGKSIKTPAQNDFICSSKFLATLVQQEWAAQNETIEPDSMPVTQFISTSIDRTAPHRETIEYEILAFLETDLLYFHTASPPELAEEQHKLWSPWLEKMSALFGTLPQKTTGLRADKLNINTAQKARDYIKSLSDLELTIFVHIAQASSSFLLAAALLQNLISKDEFIKTAFCEEFFYIDFYGTAHNGLDPVLQAKTDMLERDLSAALLILQPSS
jgi:chaperone required for assembly of F1-ATPase